MAIVGPHSGLDLSADPIYRIDMIGGAYPTWLTQGATHTHEPAGSWEGGPCAKITPPTTADGGYSALGGFPNLNRGGTLAIRQLSVRFEVLFGPTFCAGQYLATGNKFIIAHAGPLNQAVSDHRPMTYLTKEGSGDKISNAVAAGTVKQHDPTGATNDWFGGSGRSDFYFTDTAAATGGVGNKPLIGPNTWLTYEFYMSGVPIAGFPNGCMRVRVTNRAGQILTTVSIPWTYDPVTPWLPVDFINEVQLVGGYYNGNTGPANAGNYQKISGLTFAANQPDFIGPREGFINTEQGIRVSLALSGRCSGGDHFAIVATARRNDGSIIGTRNMTLTKDEIFGRETTEYVDALRVLLRSHLVENGINRQSTPTQVQTAIESKVFRI